MNDAAYRAILRRLGVDLPAAITATPTPAVPDPEVLRFLTAPALALDSRTLLEVLGGSPDPTAVATLQGEVLGVIGHFQSEVATGVLGSGVLLVRGRPVADFLDLDTLARLLCPAPRPRRDAKA
jgi:hypothetical protein